MELKLKKNKLLEMLDSKMTAQPLALTNPLPNLRGWINRSFIRRCTSLVVPVQHVLLLLVLLSPHQMYVLFGTQVFMSMEKLV